MGEAAKRVVVDFRTVDVSPADYKNGTVKVACPPRSHHEYYVEEQDTILAGHEAGGGIMRRGSRMVRCDCVSNRQNLNCRNLRIARERST